MKLPVRIAEWGELDDRQPAYALVGNVDLVVIRYDDSVSVMYGRCHHRGALLADGFIDGKNLICGVHGWDYRYETGISAYNNEEKLARFEAEVRDGGVFVDEAEIGAWEIDNPQPYDRESYLGLYQDIHGGPEEPHNGYIQGLATSGRDGIGKHGAGSAMGVPFDQLPQWSDIQIVTAQLACKPLLDDVPVSTKLVIGPNAKRPLELDIPVFVSDMSFGALSEEAKVALATGAEMAGTGICSGEGGMLEDERAANSRYFYEYASGRFGFAWEKLEKVQAFHFKGGQGAKTGTGGHLPGDKVTGKIAEVRGLEEGQGAVSPATFLDLNSPESFRVFADRVREISGGIPIGFKLSAQHVEDDIDFALEVGCDYIILDGRGGGTGSAPNIFKDNISVPTIPALARARHHLDSRGKEDVTLIITGGLRTEGDFVKALALGADGIAIANSAIQAIGCLGMRACDSNNCPVGIATQKPSLRSRLIVDQSAARLKNYLESTVGLMSVLARACGHDSLSGFRKSDLTTFKREMSELTGIQFGGLGGR
jgi:methylamine---glutamate N-methyltransferase subunit C